MTVESIARIRLVSADPDRLARAYEAALGFAVVGETVYRDASFGALLDLPNARGRGLLLRLGAQEVELLAIQPAGRAYPGDARSDAGFFQHFAMVVGDMAAAFERLRAHGGFPPISTHGPQRLPQSSGGVTAFKFRDREGHPLELIAFPPENTPAAWRAREMAALGIDHSAIVVADIARSIGFYEALGFALAQKSLNRGVEQDRLDGIDRAEVEVVALDPKSAPPHLEFLGYRGAHASSPWTCADIAATSLVLKVGAGADLQEIAQNFSQTQNFGQTLVSKSIIDGQMVLRDPDGHLLWLVQS